MDDTEVRILRKAASLLPRNRKFTELEAYFSRILDGNHRRATIAGYAKLWRWSWRKVRNFLQKMDVEIEIKQSKKG